MADLGKRFDLFAELEHLRHAEAALVVSDA